MKKIILILIAFSSFSLFAQDEKIHELGINVLGTSIPLGKYASTNLEEGSGFAKIGYYFDLYYVYNKRIVGFMVKGVYMNNGLNADKLFLQEGAFNITTSPKWEILGGLVGITKKHALNEKISLSGYGLFGFNQLTMPELKAAHVAGTATLSEVKGNGWAYNLGAKASYFVGNKIRINVGLDFYTTIVIMDARTISQSDGRTYKGNIETFQPLNISPFIGASFPL